MVKKRHFWGVLEVPTDVYDQLMAMANDDLIEVGSVPKRSWFCGQEEGQGLC